MATSFIAYKEKGYWYPDSLVALIAKLLLLTIEEEVDAAQWITIYKDCLSDATMDCRPGWQNLGLDELEEEHVPYLAELIDKAIHKVRQMGDVITKNELNVLSNGGYLSDVKTDSVVRLLIYLKMILQGEGQAPNFKFTLYIEALE